MGEPYVQLYLDHWILSLGMTAIVAIALGLFLLLYSRGEAHELLFVGFLFSVTIWSAATVVLLTRVTNVEVVFWGKFAKVGSCFISPFFLHCVSKLTERHIPRRVLLGIYTAAAGMAALTIFTRLIISGAAPHSMSPYYVTAGPLYPGYVAFFIGCVIYAEFMLVGRLKTACGQEKRKYSYFLLGSLLGYAGGCMNFLAVTSLPVAAFYTFGTYGVTVFIAVTAYAIARHRLFDISIVLPKSLATGLLVGGISLIAFVSILVSHRVTLTVAPLLIVGLLVFAIGIQIILRHSRSAVHVRMGVLCGVVTLWLLALFMMQTSHEPKAALWWHHLAWIAIAFIPACAYHFAQTVALPRKTDNILIGTLYLISAGFATTDISYYFRNELYTYASGIAPKAGSIFPVYLSYLLVSGMLALGRLYQEYRRCLDAQAPETSRFHAIFWGLAFGGLATLDALQHYGINTYPLGVFGVILWICLVSPALSPSMEKSGVLNRILASRDLYRHLLSILLCYVLILGAIRAATGAWYFIAAAVLVAIIALFASAILRMRQNLERTVMTHLFRQQDARHNAMTSCMKDMLSTLNLKILKTNIIKTVATVMRSSQVSLFLLNAGRTEYLPAANSKDDDWPELLEPISPQSVFAEHLRKSQSIVMRDAFLHTSTGDGDTAHAVILKILSQLRADLCCPINTAEHLLGFLILGPKADSSSYSQDDLMLLSTLLKTAAIALVNAQFYEDLKDSELLASKSKHLRSLTTMAGGFAHEIRNPLTSIKTFLQLMGKHADDPAFTQRFIHTVNGDVARIERLIQDILNCSKYMHPIFREKDINNIVMSCLHYAQVRADEQAIQVHVDLAAHLPRVWVDDQQITQVLINILLNAVEAMTPGPGRLLIQTHRLVKASENWVQIEITDTGCGIKPEDLDHIFDPFFTTKHHRQEWEGTGLGLTIVDQIIRQHGGYIEVNSHIGEGALFVINIPADARRTLPTTVQSINNEAAGREVSKYALGIQP